MIALALICLLAGSLLFVLVFNIKTENKPAKFALLIAANTCLIVAMFYARQGEPLNSMLMNGIILFISNILAIRHILKPASPNQELYDKWHADPKNWKAGILYYNPDDKRMFPPKKVKGMGWTINFANPNSILAFLGVMLIIFTLVRLLSLTV